MENIIILILSYLFGSIPTAYIIGKTKGIDIRNYGSGNTGATNVYRIFGWKLALITFLIDMLKGFIPVYLVLKKFQDPYLAITCGMATIGGHIFSIFLHFKGGKGVATSTGVFLAIAAHQLILALIIFFIVVRISGFVSLATLTSTLIFTISSLISPLDTVFKYFTVLTAIIIFFTHIPNIKRLIKGEELKYNNK
ncbi:MAG: glycerol-3-phosphate 1-O-acyltransferase PlsY [Elusimicrobiales bacterium]|nr:glycerol-3-phosphate 1-O-acyltransferase PlsY [Elusimicrobiales bacterium]